MDGFAFLRLLRTLVVFAFFTILSFILYIAANAILLFSSIYFAIILNSLEYPMETEGEDAACIMYIIIFVIICVYPINAERCVQHLLSERLRLSA